MLILPVIVLSVFPVMGVFQVYDGSVPSGLRFSGLSVMPVLPVIAMILDRVASVCSD